MTRRRLTNLAMFAFSLAALAFAAQQNVQDYNQFRDANPGSGHWAYLADRWPAALVAVLILAGVYAVAYWWSRDPGPADDVTEFHEEGR